MTDLRKLSEAAKRATRAYETALMTPNGPWALLKIRQSAAVSEYHNALEVEHRSGSLIPRAEYERVLALLAEAREALANVTAWRAPIAVCAPELGGCLNAIDRATPTLSRIDDALAAEKGAQK